jgi:hypothetical protein
MNTNFTTSHGQKGTSYNQEAVNLSALSLFLPLHLFLLGLLFIDCFLTSFRESCHPRVATSLHPGLSK